MTDHAMSDNGIPHGATICLWEITWARLDDGKWVSTQNHAVRTPSAEEWSDALDAIYVARRSLRRANDSYTEASTRAGHAERQRDVFEDKLGDARDEIDRLTGLLGDTNDALAACQSQAGGALKAAAATIEMCRVNAMHEAGVKEDMAAALAAREAQALKGDLLDALNGRGWMLLDMSRSLFIKTDWQEPVRPKGDWKVRRHNGMSSYGDTADKAILQALADERAAGVA